MSGSVRVLVCTTHPIQYQAPVWRHLARRPDVDLKVVFGSDFSIKGYHDPGFGKEFKWDQPLTSGLEHVFLGSRQKKGFFSISGQGLRSVITDFHPDVGLVCGYMPKIFVDAVREFRRCGAKVMMRSELSDADRDRNKLKASLRALIVGRFYRRIDHFLSIGKNCDTHLAGMGVPAGKVSFAGYNIDDELFERHRQEFVPRRGELRASMGIGDDDFVFLFCGKLIPKKNPVALARAFAKQFATGSSANVRLIFLGDGELKEAVLRESGELEGGRIQVTGFVNQGELGRYYAVADCAVLPSLYEETWGLVINEAQVFGLPAVVSDRVGCHPDLIDESTGRVFPAGDQGALEAVLREVVPWIRANRDEITAACRKRVGKYSSQRAANSIASAALRLVPESSGGSG